MAIFHADNIRGVGSTARLSPRVSDPRRRRDRDDAIQLWRAVTESAGEACDVARQRGQVACNDHIYLLYLEHSLDFGAAKRLWLECNAPADKGFLALIWFQRWRKEGYEQAASRARSTPLRRMRRQALQASPPIPREVEPGPSVPFVRRRVQPPHRAFFYLEVTHEGRQEPSPRYRCGPRDRRRRPGC